MGLAWVGSFGYNLILMGFGSIHWNLEGYWLDDIRGFWPKTFQGCSCKELAWSMLF
jgi:hypothetical protein